ncbi:hypothetical protein Vadar_006365 [Vaccinium darrowii]|uniref:Uncharacterized protein n=1 Tax=Vaccinium darrowii TaxID=229202 RepID=A0ACB7WYH1_9ERIC|nr:hypothetical protein Vadar_006365 [Vaccinium darrowii]
MLKPWRLEREGHKLLMLLMLLMLCGLKEREVRLPSTEEMLLLIEHPAPSALAAPTASPASSFGHFGNRNLSHNRGSSSERGGRRGGRGGRGGRGTKKCTHCGATNHDIEFCWELHGKPAWANQAALEGEPSALAPTQITMSKTEYNSLIQRGNASPSSSIATHLTPPLLAPPCLPEIAPLPADHGLPETATRPPITKVYVRRSSANAPLVEPPNTASVPTPSPQTYEAKFIEDIVSEVKSKLTGERRRVPVHLELNRNMKNLKRKLEYLTGQENDINVEISSAELKPRKRAKKELQPRKRPKEEVEVWLRDVQRLKDDAQKLEKEVVGERKFLSRTLLGKCILEKIQEVQELQERGRVFNGLLVDELPIGRLLMPPTKYFVHSTKARNKENVWECLMVEDFRMIGVYGMGGVGKTTIMKQIHNLLLEETGKFDRVFWVTVPKAFNITTLQRDIGNGLNLDLSDVEDETIRALQLYAVLSRQKRFVLILDDLWEAFSLERVGIPEPTRSNGCKLV